MTNAMKMTRRTLALLYPLAAAFYILITSAFTGVSITANVPGHGLTGLSGSQRIVNVQLNGALTGLVNWSSPSGGVTFTTPFGSGTTATSFIPSVMITATASAGHCTIDGSGNWTSTHIVTITAQSVDDTSKSVTFPWNICANTAVVRVVGNPYQQAWLGSTATTTFDVQGVASQAVSVAVTSAPAGATYSLADAGTRSPSLTASTTGRYTLTATSAVDSSASATATIYFAPSSAPTYTGIATAGMSASLVPVSPCYADPAFTGATYTVGAGKQYADLAALPNTDTLGGGTLIQVFNTDTTGSAPSVYRNYWQFGPVSSRTATQPTILCGIPDSHGILPIIDGNDATGQSNVFNFADPNEICYRSAIVCFFSRIDGAQPHGVYTGAAGTSAGPSFVTLANFHIRNARGNVFPPGQTTGSEDAMIHAASCVQVASGASDDLLGLEIENCADGIFTEANYNFSWQNFAQMTRISGVNIHAFGNNGASTEHAIYFQSVWGLIENFYIHDAISGDLGSGIKCRGVGCIIRYGVIEAASFTRPIDLVAAQDNSEHVDTDQYLASGDYASGDASPDIIAGLEECYMHDSVYGVIIHGATGSIIHFRDDHVGYLAERAGILSFYNNTVNGGVYVFDVDDNQNSPPGHYLDGYVDFRNNIFAAISVVNGTAPFWGGGITNVWPSGAVPYIPGPPITISSWYITSGGQLVVNGTNTLINDYASGVTFAGLSGSSGACLNGSLIAVQYGGGGNFQGPTTCTPVGSAGDPISESSATATPHILGGQISAATAHGWAGGNNIYACNGTCPWQNTLPIDSHVFNLAAANYLSASATPFDSYYKLNTIGQGFTGSTLPAAMQQLPVRFQYDLATHSLQPFASAGIIGARDAASGSPPPPTLSSIAVSPSTVSLAAAATRQLTASCTYSDASTTNCTGSVTWTNGSASAFTVNSTGLLTGVAAGTGTVSATLSGVTGTAAVTVTSSGAPAHATQGRKGWQGYKP